MQARSAASSSRAWHLKRPSQKRPVQSSSRFARRAMGSFNARMNQLSEPSRRRNTLIRSESPATAAMRSGGGPLRRLPLPKTVNHRRATSSPLQADGVLGSISRTRCTWLLITAYAWTATEKTLASSKMRCSIHSFRCSKDRPVRSSTPHRYARRTQRVTQWYIPRVSAGTVSRRG